MPATIKLENEFHADDKERQKKSMSIFTYYNRMRNIGYTHEEIGNLYTDDKEFLAEAFKHRANLRQQHLENLL